MKQDLVDVVRKNGKDGAGISVLGVREAKGLEFSDVAIVNYFSFAPDVLSGGWRKLFGLALQAGVIGASGTAADLNLPLEIEVELKLYYTAVTRCRAKLFLCEEQGPTWEKVSQGSTGQMGQPDPPPTRPNLS